jgi:hypothetical protein
MPTFIVNLLNSKRFGAFGLATALLCFALIQVFDWLTVFKWWIVSETIVAVFKLIVDSGKAK